MSFSNNSQTKHTEKCLHQIAACSRCELHPTALSKCAQAAYRAGAENGPGAQYLSRSPGGLPRRRRTHVAGMRRCAGGPRPLSRQTATWQVDFVTPSGGKKVWDKGKEEPPKNEKLLLLCSLNTAPPQREDSRRGAQDWVRTTGRALRNRFGQVHPRNIFRHKSRLCSNKRVMLHALIALVQFLSYQQCALNHGHGSGHPLGAAVHPSA